VKEATKGSHSGRTLNAVPPQAQLHFGSYFLVTNQRHDRYVIEVDGIES